MRKALLGAGVAGLAALFLWGLRGLPRFGSYPGPYGDLLNSVAVGERKATDIVSAVNFDYRAFDTMGEEFILFASSPGRPCSSGRSRRRRTNRKRNRRTRT